MARPRIYLTVVLLLLIGLACSAPFFQVDESAFSTAVAQTVIAGLTQDALTGTPQLASTLTSTFTLEPPTVTYTPSETPTPTLTFTPLVLIPEISVSVDTNCRNGPGKVYDMVGALLVGEVAQVHGVDPTNKYWYIPNPDSEHGYCWVWGEYATVTGALSLVPILTPPPTPTPTSTPTATLTPLPAPSFKVSYSSLDTCVGWWVELKIKNTGQIPFKSAAVTVKDTSTSVTLSNLTNGFVDINGCLTSNTVDTLSPGKSAIISAPAFTYNPTGNKLNVKVTLCENTGQSGRCVSDTISFKP